MRRLALLPLLVLLFVPVASHAAGCTPLDCGALASPLGGSLLAVHSAGGVDPLLVFDLASGRRVAALPAGMLAASGTRYVTDRGSLTWSDPRTGRTLRREAFADARWSLVGLSDDGRRAVLQSFAKGVARFAIHDGASTRRITLRGSYGFDALRGERLFLLQYLPRGYEVRVFDLARGRLQPQPLQDAGEPALIRGSSWNRLASPDGRMLFTLYIDGNGGAMIHELDLVHARAHCIYLPETGDWNAAGAYALALAPGGRTLYAANGAAGAVVEVDVAAARATRTARFARTTLDRPAFPAAAVSRDGRRLAFSVGAHLWRYDTAAHHLLSSSAIPTARALAFRPDGRLWRVDKASLRAVGSAWR